MTTINTGSPQADFPQLPPGLSYLATQEDEVDLVELVKALWRGKWQILLTTLLAAGMAVALALWLPDTYRAEATLSPSAEQQGGGLSALAGQFGGLASLAGINLSGGGIDKTSLAVEVAKSRQFITEFVRSHKLEVPLMAAKGMDKASGELLIDPKIYNVEQQQWVREVKGRSDPAPTDGELVKAFGKIFSIVQDTQTNLVTVGIEYYSPKLAKQWVDWFVADLNAVMKARDVADARRNIDYLKQQLEKTAVADMQKVFYQLIEDQTKTLMLAEVNQEYVFKTLDPAVVPEEKAKPKRALIVVLGTLLGGMIGVMMVLVGYAMRRRRDQVPTHTAVQVPQQ